MWKLEDLEKKMHEIKTSGLLHQYILSEKDLNRQEYYLIQNGVGPECELDQSRDVLQKSYSARVWVDKSDKRLGSSAQKLFTQLPLEPQLQKLLATAKLGDEAYWEFSKPEPPPKKQPETLYQPLKNEFAVCADRLNKNLQEIIRSTRGGIFNSAELFVNKEKIRTMNSSGFDHTEEHSRLYTEVCFSNDDGRNSEEFLLTQWFAHPEQMNFADFCSRSRDFAKASLDTIRPQTAKLPVLIDGDVISAILHGAISHLDCEHEYLKLPFQKAGSEFIPAFEAEPFEMSLDPSLDFGFSSQVYDSTGAAQTPLTLVKDNKVLTNIASTKIAQYLQRSRTTTAGNLVIKAKGYGLDELKKSQPLVLEVLQFSGLFTDPMTQTFSSEIRLARLFDNQKGTVTYIKGGNLSGNFRENFRGVKWADKNLMHNQHVYGEEVIGYFGPSHALIQEVSISS